MPLRDPYWKIGRLEDWKIGNKAENNFTTKKAGRKIFPFFYFQPLNRSTVKPLNPSTVILILIKYTRYE